MNISQIDLHEWELIRHTKDKSARVYLHDDKYVKLWSVDHLDPYTTQTGLTFKFHGFSEMTSNVVGMLNPTVCPAFIETVYDENGCCGYITQAGTPASNVVKMFRFVDTMIEYFFSIGYLMRDVAQYNIIEVDGKLSIIDVDQPPIRISDYQNLLPIEREVWYRLLVDESTGNDTPDPVTRYYMARVKRELLKWAY